MPGRAAVLARGRPYDAALRHEAVHMLEHAMFLAADQQLTGAIMRVPGGIVHVVVALILLVTWIRRSEPGTGGSGTTRRAPPVPPR